MRELNIECEDGLIVLNVDDDGFTTHCVDFSRLDADLAAIDASLEPMNDEELSMFDGDDWDDAGFGKWLENCGDGE